ncbi:MAG: AI-2E family transporter [Xanthobacteraceae bacterium]|nr:AI-2E family transporter [Xanthobacteraceae bacterium]
MTFQRQVLFWVGALILLVLAMWVLREVLLPFVAGIVLAYFLNPVADRLERYGVSRMVASLIMVAVVIFSFVVLALLFLPILGTQVSAFVQGLPSAITRLQTVLTDETREWLTKIVGERLPDLNKSLGDIMTEGAKWIVTFLASIWAGGQALFSIVTLIVIAPVIAFYVLYDWHKMIAKVDSWVPRKNRETVRELAREIDRAIAGFVRGQAGVGLILGAFYAVALTLAGLNFGFLIGMISGLISFIPYVGSLTGLLLASVVAIAQFWPEWKWILLIIAIFFSGQFLEGYILQPKLVGESVGLHPVWLMFALFAFGYLFGFVGLLLAVPLAAAMGVVIRFGLRQYMASALYTGGAPPKSRKDR